MNKPISQTNRGSYIDSGFAMLFTVLIVSLILSISLGISNLTFKQTILSSLAKDSQIAFYQADTAIECGMYYDTSLSFPVGTDPASISSPIFCGNERFQINMSQSYTDYLIFNQVLSDQSSRCSTIIFDKVTNVGANEAIVQGLGYNTCSASPRQVQRALQVTYSLAP